MLQRSGLFKSARHTLWGLLYRQTGLELGRRDLAGTVSHCCRKNASTAVISNFPVLLMRWRSASSVQIPVPTRTTETFLLNTNEAAHTGLRCLRASAKPVAIGERVCVSKRTYLRPCDFHDSRYDPAFSPLVYSRRDNPRKRTASIRLPCVQRASLCAQCPHRLFVSGRSEAPKTRGMGRVGIHNPPDERGATG